MATPDNLHHQASSCFLNRLLALPPVSDALALTTSIYQRTKDYRYVGTVVGAAENSLRVAVMGVMPHATPILHSVGDWQALDEWACRSLDIMVQMAPIVKMPTNEVVEDVRGRVLALVAGAATTGQPLTLTTALTARVNYTVELVSGSRGGRVAAGVTENLLDKAQSVLDHYLPPEEGHLQDSDGKSDGVVTKASTLAHKTRLRLYRATHSVLHPQHPDCDASTPTQLVGCATAGAREWYWVPWQEPGEDQQTTVARVLLSMALDACVRLAASLRALLRLVPSINPSSAATLAAQGVVHLSRDLADKTRELLDVFLHFTIFCLAVEDKVLRFREWSGDRLCTVLTSCELWRPTAAAAASRPKDL